MRVILCSENSLKYRVIDNIEQIQLLENNTKIVIDKKELYNKLDFEVFNIEDYDTINIQNIDNKWEKLKNWLNEYVQFQEKLKITNSKFCGNYITGNIIDVNDVLKKMEDLEKGEKDDI